MLFRRSRRGRGGSTSLSVQSQDLPNFRTGWLDERTGHAGCTCTLAVLPRDGGSWDASKRRWNGAFSWLIYTPALYLTCLCCSLLDLIAQTPAPPPSFTLLCDVHACGALLGVVQHKQHRLELHRHVAFTGCTHPLLHMFRCTIGRVGQSFDG